MELFRVPTRRLITFATRQKYLLQLHQFTRTGLEHRNRQFLLQMEYIIQVKRTIPAHRERQMARKTVSTLACSSGHGALRSLFTLSWLSTPAVDSLKAVAPSPFRLPETRYSMSHQAKEFVVLEGWVENVRVGELDARCGLWRAVAGDMPV